MEELKIQNEQVEVEAQGVPTFESKEVDALYGALAKAQLEMEEADTSKVNSHFKSSYSTLADIVKCSRSSLAKNGLAVIQRAVTRVSGRTFFSTRLCHTSGQWIESQIELTPPNGSIQILGSYLTYLRRYMYAAMVGVVVSDDDDDDGNKAVRAYEKNEQEKKLKQIRKNKISREQCDLIAAELVGFTQIADFLMKKFSLNKLSDLEASKYGEALRLIEKCKKKIEETKKNKE